MRQCRGWPQQAGGLTGGDGGAGVALLALAIAFFVLLHARHSRSARHDRTAGTGAGSLVLPNVQPQHASAPGLHSASTGNLADAARSESSHSQASALKALLDGGHPDPAAGAVSNGSSGAGDREGLPYGAQHAGVMLGRHGRTPSAASGFATTSTHSGSARSSRGRSGGGGAGGEGSGGLPSRQVSSIRDIRESVNNAVADVQGELSCEEPSFKVFSVLGQGGFGTVYHGVLCERPPPPVPAVLASLRQRR